MDLTATGVVFKPTLEPSCECASKILYFSPGS